ncbi:MAG TPA: hypothetical protein VFD58_31805 [Blastocatellia bacterium]|nr:hypothetical protein [Blastocatellia bacterium]
MKAEIVADQTTVPGVSDSIKPHPGLAGKLGLTGRAVIEFLVNLDFAIQVRLALWAMRRRRRKGERPRIL